jgi:GAF domain-containing protein
MTAPWAALRATRARELEGSWEHLVAAGGLEPELAPEATQGLRSTIVESWRRSFATGLKPTDVLAPIEVEQSEVRERWLEHPLGSVAHVLGEQLRILAEDSKSLVLVTDASGLVLHRVGADWLKERAAEMHLVEGARYSEAVDGTNGIGTALVANHAFQVFAFEHFNARHHDWICSGAPLHDPVSGRVIGLIDLSTLWRNAPPQSLELVTAAARTMEHHLLDARLDRDARLLRRYGDLASRSTDLLVSGDGYVLTGDEPTHPTPLDIPEGGGEIVLGTGSLAVAEPLGQGEAFLVRNLRPHGSRTAPRPALERAEERARQLASEQAALRQAATLVAREASPGRLFAVVTEQVAQVFDVPHVRLVRYEADGLVVVGAFSEGDDDPFPIGSHWPLDTPGVAAIVRDTGRPARVEDFAQLPGQIAAAARGAGMRSAVGSPIVVEGRLWGTMLVLSPRREPLPGDTEARLTDFTELVATAIANAESRVAVARLADEQAALRRVATLVAEDVPAGELFDAVTREVGTLLGGDFAGMARFEDDAVVTVGVWAAEGEHPPVPEQWPMVPGDPATTVAETGGPARWDDWADIPGPIAEYIRGLGIRSTVGTPIMVAGRLWGALALHSKQDAPLAPDTESRMGQFTDLVGTAVANAEARDEAGRLAEEQAALRRVATLVAQQPSPGEVFTAVTEAVGLLLDADIAVLHVFPGDGTATTIASWSAEGTMLPIESRFPLDGDNLAARIFESGAPARIQSGEEEWERETTDLARSLRLHSAVGAPIVVEGKLWGTLMAATRRVEPWAEDAETRLADFTELAATAIANAESRKALAELADEQAALRRVATSVAQGASPSRVLDAVAAEMERVLGADGVTLMRYEPDEEAVLLAHSGVNRRLPSGSQVSHKGENVTSLVRRSRRSARIDHAQGTHGPMAELARSVGARWTVGAPVVVEGRLWGVGIANWSEEQPPPPDTEERMARFAELLDTAIANADSRDQLTASRARLVTEGDEARRRVVRDLHDGAQQRLVHTIVTLKLAQRAFRQKDGKAESLVADALEHAEHGNAELRELAHGILPAALTRGGLRTGIDAVVSRLDLPVGVDVPARRFPAEIEASAYFIVAEALTNVVKHACAERAEVRAFVEDELLHLEVRDDGIGGADRAGHGLVGLGDRAAALGGLLRVETPAAGGTLVAAALPLAAD